MKGPRYFVGTSGWHYGDWRGRFYPPDLPPARWLGYYAQHFATVEVNATFYHLLPEKTFQNWREATPPGFIFAVKASRFITHIKRLKEASEPLERFLSRARHLGEKLGPVLYQLPPGLDRDDALLGEFLSLLPRDMTHVFEFRHTSWFASEVLELLRRHGAAFCVQDMPKRETPVAATAGCAYVRFHGPTGRYAGSYDDATLARWAKSIRELAAQAGSAFVYFNNDVGGAAIGDAQRLLALLTQGA